MRRDILTAVVLTAWILVFTAACDEPTAPRPRAVAGGDGAHPGKPTLPSTVTPSVQSSSTLSRRSSGREDAAALRATPSHGTVLVRHHRRR